MKVEEKKGKADELIREIRKGLLRWYDFKPGSSVLYVGDEQEPLAEDFRERGLQVVNMTCEKTAAGDGQRTFDYIVSITDLELSQEPERLLAAWKKLLRPDGHMLLGMNNRFGIRYFCGDRDPYTGRNMDSIENYRRAYVSDNDPFRGRMYDKDTLRNLLKQAGIENFRFYSVMSDLQNPVQIFGEDYLPREDLANRIFPTYNHPDTVFLEEETLYDGLKRNDMFHQMVNAWIIECTVGAELSDVIHVTGSLERGRDNALVTVIHKSGLVEKRAVYPEGEKKLYELVENGKDLQAHGLQVVEAGVIGGVYRMPYVDAESGQLYLKRLLYSDKEQFLKKMDHFRDLILQSSEIERSDMGDGEGPVLSRGYFDLVPLNSFWKDDEFLFYDQEFCIEHYPANVLILRMISSFYLGNMEFNKIISIQELFERYGLSGKVNQWYRIEGEFLRNLLNKRELQIYYEKCRRNIEVVNTNRQRMNYSPVEYQRIFEDIFKGTTGRKIILFGAGTFARHFLQIYGKDYPIYAVLDNRADMWGQELDGIPIKSPDILRQMRPDEYKVLICIKNYLAVMKQLADMGIKNFSIYDSAKTYKGVENIPAKQSEGSVIESKKYHIGYVAGVFDMFHIGHLNLLRRAKEMCDYLIVGVMPDETVYRKKDKYPVIPGEDRVEIVRACKYVDRAEILPFELTGIREAYKMFQFDCQFTGSDYAEHPYWLADKEYLEKQGADLVFFPYTEKISSTLLREQRIEE